MHIHFKPTKHIVGNNNAVDTITINESWAVWVLNTKQFKNSRKDLLDRILDKLPVRSWMF